MPMDRSLYPKNWTEIASQVKAAADWQCEECGKPCRRPGESVEDLEHRLASLDPLENYWIPMFYGFDPIEDSPIEMDYLDATPKPQRFTLTVAHLDHNPANCDCSNLKALCAPCHCRYDLSQMARKKYLKRERDGQLNLLEGLGNG